MGAFLVMIIAFFHNHLGIFTHQILRHIAHQRDKSSTIKRQNNSNRPQQLST